MGGTGRDSETARTYVGVRVVAWLSDEPFPGMVKAELVDGDKRTWVFVDKAPIFDGQQVLRRDSAYPVNLEIACTVLERRSTPHGVRVIISTAKPWGIETPDGRSVFEVNPEQVRKA